MANTSRDGDRAASATYRKGTKLVAKELNVQPMHTRHPSDDFTQIVNRIDPESRKRALKLYRLGLRRGLQKAIQLFGNKTIKIRNGKVCGPPVLQIKVGIKFSKLPRQSRQFKFAAQDIGLV